ncbi:hypothetical protein ACNKHS_16675 [Shigella flexneri]
MSKIVKVIGRGPSTPGGTRPLKPKFIWKVVSSVWQLLHQVLYGSREALDLCDGDKSRFMGRRTESGWRCERSIAQAIVGKDAKDQAGIDKIMIDLDGTETNATSVPSVILLYPSRTPKQQRLLKVCHCSSTSLN